MDSLVRLSEINQAKTFEFNLTLSKEQNLQLIKRLDLLSLKKVSFMGNLSPLAEDRWALKAKLRATVKQKCVITLKPVQTIVSETVNRTFVPLDMQKSTEIIDLIKSEVAKLMGIEALVNIDISETINTKEEGGISAAQEIFDVEDLS